MAPQIAPTVEDWVRRVYGKGIATAFLDSGSYPLVHMPFWANQTIDRSFLEDVTRSSIAGYVWIRLIDDAMDGDRDGAEMALLPSLSFFHLQFTGPYQDHFPAGHHFWVSLSEAWIESGQAAILDHGLEERDLSSFQSISARKTRAAIIPVIAALYESGSLDRVAGWSSFVDSFNVWHQFQNDLFDWRRDLQHGNTTFLLSRAWKNSDSPTGVERWFWDQGLEWATGQLAVMQAEATRHASVLASAPLDDYLEWRFTEIGGRLDYIREGLTETRRLSELFGQGER